jgi:RHS repeat-associated protein
MLRREGAAGVGGGLANVTQAYDGDRLRVVKTDSGVTTYYLRSSVLGGQVVAEIKNNGSSWYWDRGYVYLGSHLLAVQYQGAVTWVHSDPVTKSQRATNASGNIVSTATVDTDPWGGETSRSAGAFQPHKFTTYERDGNHSDEAMMRRYNRWGRFDQPDPYDGSYDLSDPQSFIRYSYTGNDPVNFVDPTGLDWVKVRRLKCQSAVVDGADDNSGKGQVCVTVDEWVWVDPAADFQRAIPTERGGENPQNNGVNDMNKGFTSCGIAASLGEYSNQLGGKWVGWTNQGPKLYSMSRAGNQYVSRTAALEKASAFRALSRVSFFAGTAISGYQGYQALDRGDYVRQRSPD